ncbi:MAG: PilZ domain-containing protein [Rhodocyclales bacterium]|nr:PilZ domain-containing protein [Rhodocyclales bacterium]
MEPERRTDHRRPLRTPVTIVAPGKGAREGKTLDLSLSGLSVVVREPLAVHDQCALRLLLPVGGKRCSVDARATVVYCVCSGMDGFRLGLRFGTMSNEAAALIARYMNG